MVYQTNTEQVTLHEFAEILSETHQWSENLLEQIEVIKKCTGIKRSKEIGILENKILLHLQTPDSKQVVKDNALKSQQKFRDRLQKLFPSITQNEAEICCYIKLELKNDTIATLKGIDLSSIGMAKYRIKKKLQLQSKIRLDQYLQTF